ncbi:pur operon repressor [Aerococcaceae bacterium DSM 111022]|nr:pur operon repressor [Aerococcaceae bacterium DSM 111022]
MSDAVYKPKRNERLIFITQFLTERPNQLIKLSYFTEKLNAAKSSVSEDINHVREFFIQQETGDIVTVPGASGGVIFRPAVSRAERENFIDQIESKMHERKRILPGNYIQLTDILQNPYFMNVAASIIAQAYQEKDIDKIVTIEAQGIGLAAAVARLLHVPFVVARRNARDTIGSTISVSYVSGSRQKVTKMELPTDSLDQGDRVLIIDDFLRHGGTVTGLISLLEEFNCTAEGVCVMVENMTNERYDYVVDALFTVNLGYNAEKRQFDIQVDVGEITQPKSL